MSTTSTIVGSGTVRILDGFHQVRNAGTCPSEPSPLTSPLWNSAAYEGLESRSAPFGPCTSNVFGKHSPPQLPMNMYPHLQVEAGTVTL